MPNTENPTLALLREIRAAQQATDAKLDDLARKIETLTQETIGLKDPVRRVEEDIEAIADVVGNAKSGHLPVHQD